MTRAPRYTLRWSARAERNDRVVYRVDGGVVVVVTIFAGQRNGWPNESDPDTA